MSYSFYCSRCKVDHAGECPPSFFGNPCAAELNGALYDAGKKDVMEGLSSLIKALEAGGYNAAPLRECQRTSPNDLCGPCDPSACDHAFTYLGLADVAKHHPPGSPVYEAANLAFVNGNADYVTIDAKDGTVGWTCTVKLPQPLTFIPIVFDI